jgi:hypothetical protein
VEGISWEQRTQMIPLNSDQKQLIFDYCLGLISPEQTAEAKALITSNKQAQVIHANLKAVLKPLDSIEPEPCPDSLAERTIWRLNSVANSSRQRLQELLAGEQKRKFTAKDWLRGSFGRRLATAAVLMVAGTLLLTTFNAVSGYARYQSFKKQCQLQQSSIFQGLHNYMSDHDGQSPAVATSAGDPWWKVGHQGDENHSNTRRVYILAKDGYVKPDQFVCPACADGEKLDMSPSQLSKFKDFPSRRYISYSFQIICRKNENGELICTNLIMADRNPIFEQLPKDFSKPLTIRLNKKQLNLNSNNHNRRGQNVLCGDGHVEFLKTPFFGTDDIFTLQNTNVYHGCEVPSCDSDFFVAP